MLIDSKFQEPPVYIVGSERVMCERNGSPGRIRTSDQPVNSRLLYH